MDSKVLSYQPATSDEYDEYFHLMRCEMGGTFESLVNTLHVSWDEFARLFRTVGSVFSIYDDREAAGFYWIEQRENILHLHGLIIKEQFRGQGVGTAVLAMLEEAYKDSINTIELGVEETNARAKALYERLGYKVVSHRTDVGFYILQKPISTPIKHSM